MAKVRYDYADETVVVTGGSSGIGRAIATRFGEAGATVVNADVMSEPKEGGRPTHERVSERGGEGHFVKTDVADPMQLHAVVDAAREFGGVDVMVNNAAVTAQAPMLEAEPESLDRLYEVNVRGVYVGCQIAARDMIDRDEPGVVLNTASISSTVAQFDQVQYDATKGAVRMITRGASLELADHGIRVNAVAPGQIATEMVEGWSDEARHAAANDELIKPVPLGRAGSPADVAGAALFLASDDASYVTGEILYVDGGWQVF